MRSVVVGFLSFTEVPAHAQRAYDAWHRLDHLPEQYAIEGIVLGQRWVASPRCRAARRGDPDEVLARTQHLTLYLMTEPVEDTLRAFRQLAAELRAAGRFFADREAHLAGAWRVAGCAAAPRVLVRAAVVPWRPAAGAYVVVDGDADLAELVALDGVAGGWRFERDESPASKVTVLWLDDDPLAVAGQVAPLVDGARFAGPYVPAGPGAADGF